MTSVVIDTSPLIVLFKSELAYLLPRLFTEVIVPDAVWNEIVEAGKTDIASRQLVTVSWAKKISPTTISPIITSWGLGSGESEVLSYAWENTGYKAIVDDSAARKVAKTLSIPIIGTLGILLLAKKKGEIDSISIAITALQDAGLWLSVELIKSILQQAGE